MPTLTETFDSLAQGVAVTSETTTFGQYTGTLSAVGDTATKYRGAASLSRPGTSGTSTLQATSGSAVTSQYVRLYLRPSSQPSVSAVLAFFDHTTTGYACDVRVLVDGRVQLRNSTFSLIQNSTTTLPLNEWSRIEMAAVDGVATVRIFVGDPQAAAPTETLSGPYAQTSINRVAVGGTNTATWSFNLDEIVLSETAWPGPVPDAPVTSGFLYYDTGSQMVDVSDNIWYHNGTAWVKVALG